MFYKSPLLIKSIQFQMYKQISVALILILLCVSADCTKLYQPLFKLSNYFEKLSSRDRDHQDVAKQEMIKMIDSQENGEKRNLTIIQENLFSNMIVTPKYALMGKCNSILFGTLIKLDFATMKLQTIYFKRPFNGFSYYMLQIADLRNGDIAVGEGTYLYIFNNQTLKLKQTLNQSQIVIEISLTYKGETCLIKRGDYKIFELRKNSVTNQYYETLISYDFEPPSNTFPTGDNTAVTINTIRGCQVSYWNNDEPILKISYDSKDYLEERIPVAVSYSESFFVVKNKWDHQYQFYNLEENLQITLKNSVFVDNNTYQKGFITTDDNYLFISTLNTNTGQTYIYKIDIKAQSVQTITDQHGNSDNQIDFNLFDIKTDRFISLISRNQKEYYLQLRSINDLSILDEYYLSFDFAVRALKLVGNIQWGSSFSLVAKISPQKQYDSTIYLFSMKNDKISSLHQEGQVNFQFVQAAYKYVITYKRGAENMDLLHYYNFSLALSLDSRDINDDELKIQKNILTFTQYFRGCYIYDLSQSLQRKSILYKDSQMRIFDRFVTIIFPLRGLLYETPLRKYALNEVTKAVYDISKPSVAKKFKLDGEVPCVSPVYFTPHKNSKIGSQMCSYIYYVGLDKQNSVSYLERYSECSQQLDKFLIRDVGYGILSQLFISSDEKYIIMFIHREQPNILLQIRPINGLNEVIHHEILEFRTERDTYAFWFNADLINDTMIVVHASYYVSVTYIQPRTQKEQNAA